MGSVERLYKEISLATPKKTKNTVKSTRTEKHNNKTNRFAGYKKKQNRYPKKKKKTEKKNPACNPAALIKTQWEKE